LAKEDLLESFFDWLATRNPQYEDEYERTLARLTRPSVLITFEVLKVMIRQGTPEVNTLLPLGIRLTIREDLRNFKEERRVGWIKRRKRERAAAAALQELVLSPPSPLSDLVADPLGDYEDGDQNAPKRDRTVGFKLDDGEDSEDEGYLYGNTQDQYVEEVA